MSSLSGRAGGPGGSDEVGWSGAVQPETARAGSSRTVTASGVVSERAGTRVPGIAAARNRALDEAADAVAAPSASPR